MERITRKAIGLSKWSQLRSLYGDLCFYCSQELAQSVDHVLPTSEGGTNDIWNLRPCCMWCNQHASNKVFESVEEKREFLIEKRRANRRLAVQTLCTTCLLPFQRPHMTSSLFECPICNPESCDDKQMREWNRFMDTLQRAGFIFSIHRDIRKMYHKKVKAGIRRKEAANAYMQIALDKLES
jgi:hypothetical protein